jgi:hypothetical protein
MLIYTVQSLFGSSVNPRTVMFRITNGSAVPDLILGETAERSVRLVRRQITSLSWRWRLQSNQLFDWPVALANTLNVEVLVVISRGAKYSEFLACQFQCSSTVDYQKLTSLVFETHL